MPFGSTSIAAAVAAGAKNVQFAVEAQNVPHKVVIIANYDETNKTGIVEFQPYQITSPDDAGDKFGFGFQANRLAIYAELGHRGIPTWVIPVKWDVAPGTEGTATITIVGTLTAAGVFNLYISGEKVPVSMAIDDDPTGMAGKIVAKVNATKRLGVTAANVVGVVTFTSKDKNAEVNKINVAVNLGLEETFPEGLTSAVIVAMSGGVGVMEETWR